MLLLVRPQCSTVGFTQEMTILRAETVKPTNKRALGTVGETTEGCAESGGVGSRPEVQGEPGEIWSYL